MSYLTHALDAIEGHLADLICKGGGGGRQITVTELSGGQFSLKSISKWKEPAARVCICNHMRPSIIKD